MGLRLHYDAIGISAATLLTAMVPILSVCAAMQGLLLSL